MSSEGPAALYRGMGAPLASVTFQNAMVFQTYAILSRALDSSASANDPPSYKGVALGGLEQKPCESPGVAVPKGPLGVAKSILKTEGLKGMYRGFVITVLRDAPAYVPPWLQKNGQESVRTVLTAGGLAGVASWLCCYPLDVVKTRLQAQSPSSQLKYRGILDCFSRSVKEDGYCVLWRGLGTAVARAFVVNGAVFASYETALRFLFNNGNIQAENTI
ncbi:mitochondrial arginine transporter BAC2-like [Populus alba x Populus x berolinensis]|uniref:Mitochondrial arginine transporter BAC2-like n=1 Tax=Populus alba x Populus x berolinensis TaxID=444605 RepID=A0AAD6R4T8_9ROSI|nr:mitochondrial arginine transporter BAC2-like [Populus alba x Populus x berolinensis]